MSTSRSSSDQRGSGTTPAGLIAFAWTLVGIPLAYGLYQTVTRAVTLFTG